MIGSAFAFSVMSLLVKGAGERLPSQEIVLARALVSLVISWALLRRAGVEPWGRRRALLLLRGVLGFAALSCVFYALTRLPLAAATVIQYLHPVFTAVLAAALLGERVGRRLPLSIALGLLGVVLVTRPAVLFGAVATPLDPFAVVVAVAGALLTACAYVVVRKLASAEHPLVIVLYFPLVTVPASLPALAGGAIWPRGWEWALLLGVGVFTQIGQVALTRGMQLEPAGRATALSYSQVLFAALWGVLFFGEIPGPSTATGAALILASTLLTAFDHD
jgi:drug/metabolite transporter (DMT)-like permease